MGTRCRRSPPSHWRTAVPRTVGATGGRFGQTIVVRTAVTSKPAAATALAVSRRTEHPPAARPQNGWSTCWSRPTQWPRRGSDMLEQEQPTAGDQDPPKLRERPGRLRDRTEHAGAQHFVDRAVRQRQGVGVGREQRHGYRVGRDPPPGQGTHRGVGLDGDHRRHGGRQVVQVVARSEPQDQQPTARVGQHRRAQPTEAAPLPRRGDEPVDLREDRMGVITLTAHTSSIRPSRAARDHVTRIVINPASRRCRRPFVGLLERQGTPTLAWRRDSRQKRTFKSISSDPSPGCRRTRRTMRSRRSSPAGCNTHRPVYVDL